MLVIALMSGTSLDGLDLALCQFEDIDQPKGKILYASTQNYDATWLEELKNAHKLSGLKLEVFHHYYGKFLGLSVLTFLEDTSVQNILREQQASGESELIISSHGHTLFHDPDLGITFQAGHGADIMAITQIPVVCDFRVQDVALSGQGAPLVPIGDQILFGEYEACINLGGFANISMQKNGERIAWDICPFNIVLNDWAVKLGDSMDREGRYSREGKLLYEVLDKWNNLEYYKKEAPKSLGREWVEGVYLEGLYEDILLPKDLMHTAVNHFAKQIAQQLPKQGRVLITGGGAYNSFFNEKLRSETSCELIYPSKEIIEFKEALIFGLLGYLRWNNKINVLKSVTGASQNHSSGIIYLP